MPLAAPGPSCVFSHSHGSQRALPYAGYRRAWAPCHRQEGEEHESRGLFPPYAQPPRFLEGQGYAVRIRQL